MPMRAAVAAAVLPILAACASVPAPEIGGAAFAVTHVGGRRVAAGTAPGFRLSGDRIEGSDGCNRFFGPAELGPDGALRIGQLAGTLMACPGPVMAEAGRITAALQAAQRLVPQPDGTVRLEAAGQPALTLRPQAG